MLDRVAATSASETGKKLFAHYDYFGYVIPMTWFLFLFVYIERVLFQQGPLLALWDRFTTQLADFLKDKSTPLQIVVSVAVLLLAFNLMYILGHVLNGISALFLDRLLVKKYLKYPTELYLRKMTSPASADSAIVRRAAIESSYSLTAFLNIGPLVLLELVGFLVTVRRPDLVQLSLLHTNLIAVAVAVLLRLHCGWPSMRAARVDEEGDYVHQYALLRKWHAVFLLWLFLLLYTAVLAFHSYWPLAVLPILNLILAFMDKALREGVDYRSKIIEKHFLYLRCTFQSWVYFCAQLSGYGHMPSRETLGAALSTVGASRSTPSDFWWLSSICLENLAPRSHPTAYHFMSLSGMNRNLCGSTLLAIGHFLGLYCAERGHHVNAAGFTAFLLVMLSLALLFLLRYLYLYSGYYSKFVVRVAAFLALQEDARRVTASPVWRPEKVQTLEGNGIGWVQHSAK